MTTPSATQRGREIDTMEMVVGETRYGVPLSAVIEIAGRVHIARLPGVEPPLVGYIAYRGRPVAVVDLRWRFDEAPAPVRLDQHLVIVETGRRALALLVDRVRGVRRVDVHRTRPGPEGATAVAGVVALEDEVYYLADLEEALSVEEERALDEALARLEGA